MKKELIVYVDNHFDPMWRRRFEGRMVHKGQAYASYTEIEAYYILDNLALARRHPEYKFQIESVIVVKQFLKYHPELTRELQDLQKAGRLYIPGAGYCIIDANMVSGESVIRNFLLGNRWTQEVFGYTPKLAIRNDAFGNPAQLPQILRGTGYQWLDGLYYVTCARPYWKGLDGSVVCLTTLPTVGGHGNWSKQVPCPACNGFGDLTCTACGGRGIDMQKAVQFAAPEPIDDSAFGTFAQGLYRVGTEEGLPVVDTIRWAEGLAEAYDIRFGFQEDAYPYVAEAIARCDDPDIAGLAHIGELNPACTGCYVARIQTKLTVRRHETEMAAAEALEAMAFVAARQSYRDRLNAVWEQMLFEMDHDAITGAHVNAANDELLEIGRQADSALRGIMDDALQTISTDDGDVVSVLNTTGQAYTGIVRIAVPEGKTLGRAQNGSAMVTEVRGSDIFAAVYDLPPYAVCRFPLVDATAPVPTTALPAGTEALCIQNDHFRIHADGSGLLSIQDLQSNRIISEAGAYRPGELILEHDEGSPWATLHPAHTEHRLSAHTKLVAYQNTGKRQYLQYECELPMQQSTAMGAVIAKTTIALTEGIPHVAFEVDVRWRSANERLRVMFPCMEGGRHMYEVPYGMMERRPYTPEYHWAGINGDWAAANWAGVEGANGSVAVFNKGTLAYRIDDADGGAVIGLSLLRSPIYPTYLHEPEVYSMTDWDGMRDEGEHHLEFALASYQTPFAENSATPDAQAYNAVLPALTREITPPALPVVQSGHVRLAAIKIAEDATGLILRLAEYHGQAAECTVLLPDWVAAAHQTDMMERFADSLPMEDRRLHLTLKPFEIATICVQA